MESEKWDKKRMDDAMKESEEEFVELTKRLIDIMVDFCVRALKTFEAGRGEALNPLQVDQVIMNEVKHVLNQISDPNYIGIIARKAEIKYTETLKGNSS